MTWTRPFGNTEIALIVAFVLLYGAFLFRNIRIARRLRSKSRSIYIKLLLRSAYFGLFIIALMGPSIGEQKKEIRSVGKDIYIAVDLSQSMNAYDVQPSRLEKVKYALKSIVKAFGSDRMGLIIFSSDAFVQCPLTYDLKALNMFIETLSTNLVAGAGTDFGNALSLALQKILDKKNSDTENQAKVILLISDGEDFGENTSEIAQDIEDNGIKLFTLGVGTKEGSPIPAANGPKRDKEGNKVITTLNSNDLRNLAKQTGGQYFEINKQVNEINLLINAISQIEGVLRDVRKVDVTANKYSYFLGAALILLVCDILFTIKIIKL